jgi:dynein heavy chain 2
MKTKVKELNMDMDKFLTRYTAMKPKKVTELDKELAIELGENMRGWTT